MSEEMLNSVEQPQEQDETEGFIVDGVESQESAEQNTEEQAAKEDTQPPPRKVSKAEKRIKKLIAEKYALLEKLEQLERQQKQPTPNNDVDSLSVEDFDTFEDYLKAVEELQQEPEQEDAPPQGLSPLEVEYRKSLDTLAFSFEDATEKYPDFVEVVQAPDAPFTPEVVIGLASLDNPSEVAYYLGKHKDLLANIAQQSPERQLVELGKLSVSLNNDRVETTKMPKPIDPVNPSSVVEERDPSKMSFSEYEKWAKKQSTTEDDWL